MLDFKALKKKKEDMKSKILSEGEKKDYDDDRFWKYYLDEKTELAECVIRFLPELSENETPYVKLFYHSFKNDSNGRWYINNCLTTIGKEDPVVDHVNELFDSGQDELGKKRARKVCYISNILVVEDKNNPENEGKVFLFKYGQEIFKHIQNALKPKFKHEKEKYAFDPFDGSNFVMCVYRDKEGKDNKKGYIKYDKCYFDEPSPLAETEEKMTEICENAYSLQEFISDDQFESYEKLKDRLDYVLGLKGKSKRKKNDEEDDSDDQDEEDEPTETEKPKRRFQTKSSYSESNSNFNKEEIDEDDDSDDQDEEDEDDSAIKEKFKRFGKLAQKKS